jgi:hypothetical protein
MTNAARIARLATERSIRPMQKSSIGKGALVLAALLGLLTVLSLVAARTSPEEAKALADLRRIGCMAQAITIDAQTRCREIQPESAFITDRLKISGFLAITTLMSLGFGLAILARPDGTEAPGRRTEQDERARQRRLTLAAQEKLREERAKREAEG